MVEGMSTQPRRLSVGTLRPRDVVLEIDGVEYDIRGDIPISGMISLMMIHKRLQAIDGVSEDDAIAALEAVEEANKVIVSIIRERHPDAVVRSLGVQEVTGVLGFLVGNDGGPIAEVEEALVAGIPEPTEAEIQQRINEAVERQRLIDKGLIDDVPPTSLSRSDSSTPSSTSEITSSGPPNGGTPVVGEPSEPTASSQTDG